MPIGADIHGTGSIVSSCLALSVCLRFPTQHGKTGVARITDRAAARDSVHRTYPCLGSGRLFDPFGNRTQPRRFGHRVEDRRRVCAWLAAWHPYFGKGQYPLPIETKTGYQNLCRLITNFKLRERRKGEGAATRLLAFRLAIWHVVSPRRP
jgi:hypothetical protein